MLELGGIGPTPFAVMMLADLGADVVRVDRLGRGLHEWDDDESRRVDVLARGRRSIALDLKRPEGREIALQLCGRSDVLIEGMRPGVTERLGLGPADCSAVNPRLVYGRMTGWGQTGPYSQMAGHDINYIALAGVLDGIGLPGAGPTPPLNYVGDFGGGSTFLVVGVLAALQETQRSGKGQVVDAAMVDGAITLNAGNYSMLAWGWNLTRGESMLSGAAPHYGAYQCSDGSWVSVAANESQFYALLREKLQLDGELWDDQLDTTRWAERRQVLAGRFRERTRDEWCDLLEFTDVCFAPVLDLVEAAKHPHNQERQNIVEHHGVLQPAPAPRFDRTPGILNLPPPLNGEHTRAILTELGYDEAGVDALLRSGAVEARSNEP